MTNCNYKFKVGDLVGCPIDYMSVLKISKRTLGLVLNCFWVGPQYYYRVYWFNTNRTTSVYKETLENGYISL